MLLPLYLLLFLFYLPFSHTQSNTLDKRQAVAPQSCADQLQTVAVCSPSPSDVWYNNTYHELTWKYNNPVFNGYETLTFYLLQQRNSTSYSTIKSFDVVHAVGVQVVLIDNSWFPSLLPDNSPNVTRTVYAYLLGAGVDLQKELANTLSFYPRPTPFTLIQNAHNTTATASNTASPTSSSTLSVASAPTTDEGSSLPTWAIVVIVIAVIAVIVAAIALIWLIRNIRRNRQRDHQPLNKNDLDHDEGLDRLNDNNNGNNINNNDTNNNGSNGGAAAMTALAASASTMPSSHSINNNNNGGNPAMMSRHHPNQIETRDLSSSIHSSTPIMHGSMRGSPTVQSPSSIERSPSIVTSTTQATNTTSPNMNMAAILQQQQADNASHQTSSILSSTDALMIADTFRQFMRKPDWSETQGRSDDPQEDDEEEEEEGNDNEQKRIRVGNELLKKQLAEEGATVKDIERR